MNPSLEHWSPWIGKDTRKSDLVLNMEFAKLSASKSSTEAEVSMMSEDRLVDELLKQKVCVCICVCTCMFYSVWGKCVSVTALQEATTPISFQCLNFYGTIPTLHELKIAEELYV